MVSVLAVTGTALALTGFVGRDDAPDRPHASSGTTTTTDTTAPEATITCRSPLTGLDPLRLWIGGDSLAGSLGPSLGKLTGDTGVVQPVFNSRVSSGLANPDLYDWPKHANEDIFEYRPEVAVFIIGANDAKNAPAEGDGLDPEWRSQYRELVEKMMDLLVGDGRTVYWIGAPIMEDDDYSERVRAVNDVFKEVALGHPDVVYVDAYTAFAEADGTYADFLPADDGSGETDRVRAEDGVHFTAEGGDHLASVVYRSLDPVCRLTEQAVPGAPLTTIEVEGSSQVPGTSREGTTETTTATVSTEPSTSPPPPTTRPAPPVTSPPSTLLPTGLGGQGG